MPQRDHSLKFIKNNMTTTNTPRTDEQIWTTDFHHKHCDVVDMEFARQLERELAEAKDDLESVRPALEAFRKTCDCLDEVGNRAEKAEAEVERLREMVMEAARKGDELLEPYQLRAEKAETLINQIHAFAEALNPTNK